MSSHLKLRCGVQMISNLENLCGVKDNEISKLKQELRSVEMKVSPIPAFCSYSKVIRFWTAYIVFTDHLIDTGKSN